jgi:hypothetical protein
MTVDLNQMFIAFALNYPGKAKQRGQLDNDGVTDFHFPYIYDLHNSHYLEYLRNPNAEELIVYQKSQYPDIQIWDIYKNVVIDGKEMIVIRSTVVNSLTGLYWIPGLPLVERYLDLNLSLGKTIEVDIMESEIINCQASYRRSFPWGNRIVKIEEYDFQGDVGTRWFMEIQSIYPVYESWAWDLGPKEGQFEPRYGCLGYKHIHDPEDIWAVELYNTLVDFPAPQYPCPTLL